MLPITFFAADYVFFSKSRGNANSALFFFPQTITFFAADYVFFPNRERMRISHFFFPPRQPDYNLLIPGIYFSPFNTERARGRFVLSEQEGYIFPPFNTEPRLFACQGELRRSDRAERVEASRASRVELSRGQVRRGHPGQVRPGHSDLTKFRLGQLLGQASYAALVEIDQVVK